MDIKRVVFVTICFIVLIDANANIEPYGIGDDGWIIAISNSDGEVSLAGTINCKK